MASDAARPRASAPATWARPPEALPLWFKIAVLLLVAIFGMMKAGTMMAEEASNAQAQRHGLSKAVWTPG